MSGRRPDTRKEEMFQNATGALPASIEGEPVVFVLHTEGSQEPQTKDLGKFAARSTIRFCVGGQRREDLKCGGEKLKVCGG